jgi:hypothetical protein
MKTACMKNILFSKITYNEECDILSIEGMSILIYSMW